MRTLEKEGSTTSERRTGVRRSALPMSAVEQALRSNVADNPFTRSNNKSHPYSGFLFLLFNFFVEFLSFFAFHRPQIAPTINRLDIMF